MSARLARGNKDARQEETRQNRTSRHRVGGKLARTDVAKALRGNAIRHFFTVGFFHFFQLAGMTGAQEIAHAVHV